MQGDKNLKLIVVADINNLKYYFRYFYIDRINDDMLNKTPYDKLFSETLNNKHGVPGGAVDFKKINIVKGKKFMYFNENESKFIRIKFNKLYHRICFIRLLNKLNIISYNNDINNYYRVVSRTYKINLSSWNIVKNYSIERNSKFVPEIRTNLLPSDFIS